MTDSVKKALLKGYDPNEEGTWNIYGEDPNPAYYGDHSEPFLETVVGTYSQVVDYALNLKGFFQWGHGGRILKTKDLKKL